MAFVIYTAKRSLVTGHALDSTQSFDFRCVPTRSRTVERRQARSLSGASETNYFSGKYEFNVRTALLSTVDAAPLFREFLDSVESGETFTLDPYGTLSAPSEPTQVTLTGRNYSEDVPDLMVVQHYQFQFTVRAV